MYAAFIWQDFLIAAVVLDHKNEYHRKFEKGTLYGDVMVCWLVSALCHMDCPRNICSIFSTLFHTQGICSIL